jgi:hypothetical protein
MTAPTSQPRTVPYQPGLFALRMLIIVVGGWVITTIARGLLMGNFEEPAAAIAIGGLLSLGWYVLIFFEAHRWWVAARAGRRDSATTVARPRPSASAWPVFGIVSVAAPFLVWLWVNEVFYKPWTGGTGESALIGLFASVLLCVVGLLVGCAAGIAALFMKERRWVAVLGIACNIGTAVILAALVSSGFRKAGF